MASKNPVRIVVRMLPLCFVASAALAAAPDAGTATGKAPTAKAASVSPTPRKITTGKLGDFEAGVLAADKDPFGWSAFQFAQAGKPQAEAKVVDGGSSKTSKKALHFEGTIPDDAQMAFIGIGCGWGGNRENPDVVDISGFKGIRFRMRGDESPYRMSLMTNAVKDYNYHGKILVAEKDWTTVDVPFAELLQIQGWGTPVAFDPKHVQGISIATMYQATGPAWFEIDDVELYK